jgi:signal transduction histidine kinase
MASLETEASVTHDFQADLDAVDSIAAIPTILDVVCRTTGMGFAAVARVTDDRWIACQVLDSIDFGLRPGGELKVETTICHEIKQKREPVVINHVDSDDRYRHHHTPLMYGFQSYISMPILLPDGQFFGTLCAIDPKPHQLTNPEVIGMFKLFAELIGFHLEAHEKLASTSASFENERRTSELREQFIAVLGHDLKNPLASIQAGTNMLLRTPLDDKAINIVKLMQNTVARMEGLIDNVLDLARGRLGGGLVMSFGHGKSPEPILSQVLSELRVSWPDRVIETRFELHQDVSADHARIGQLFSNLLGNALTHGAADKPIRVEALAGNGQFELSVSNAGDPISPHAMERLFQPFYRGQVRPSLQGLGLGLYIASEIAKAHGGALSVASSTNETRFTFKMPI